MPRPGILKLSQAATHKIAFLWIVVLGLSAPQHKIKINSGVSWGKEFDLKKLLIFPLICLLDT
jgi:hypothetical protein